MLGGCAVFIWDFDDHLFSWNGAVIARTRTGRLSVDVTHGVLRRIPAKQLIADGWTCTRREGGYGYWSCWMFSLLRPQGQHWIDAAGASSRRQDGDDRDHGNGDGDSPEHPGI
jgi:hypothetical protein